MESDDIAASQEHSDTTVPQPGGILMARWQTLRIPAGGIVLRVGSGGLQLEPVVPELALEMWPHWFEIALRHASVARQHHAQLLNARDCQSPTTGQHLDDELQSSIQTITAMAFAVDAFYGSLLEQINVAPSTKAAWAHNKTPRHARVLEAIRLGSVLRNDQVRSLKRGLSSLFKFRDWAVHPPADFRHPLLHPDLQVGVDQRFLAFSSPNADRAVLCGLEVLVRALDHPRDIAAFRPWSASMRQILDDLLRAAHMTYADSAP
ncbi:MAG TPA: hypothetical protein VN193_15315 [Candidatus Angelobacter sp.]|nr:hypothetical protein [Candidatus Angelobacter sp.]